VVVAGNHDSPSFLNALIACGAVSGFHGIVASGTSSKQVSSEKDALFVGYGSMIMEGVLATLVIIAVAAGIGMGYETAEGEVLKGIPAWTNHYSSWSSAQGLASKVSAFVVGSANMISSIGIPKSIAVVIMGVFVASFAGTSLDTSTRLQRYFLHELVGRKRNTIFNDRYVQTAIVVVTAAVLAFISGADGKGALSLWPLFGAINQILATLALFVLTIYLQKKGKWKWLVTGIPAIFMGTVTLWAAIINQFDFVNQENMLLEIVNAVIIVLALWIIIEIVIKFSRIYIDSVLDKN